MELCKCPASDGADGGMTLDPKSTRNLTENVAVGEDRTSRMGKMYAVYSCTYPKGRVVWPPIPPLNFGLLLS